MTTALVTGGAGFIGSAVVRRLLGQGLRVITVDKLTYAGSLDNLAEVKDQPRHRFVQADICDGGAMRDLIASERPTVIYHLAAETHVDRSIDTPSAFIQTNVVGTTTLLSAAHEYYQGLSGNDRAGFRFLGVSTDEVFGDLAGLSAATETTPYRPSSPYAASKASADHLCRAWYRTYGLPVIISNCSNNYGPYQAPEKLIPTVILKALAGEPIPVYGRGDQVRDWLHVDDHAAALQQIVEKGEPGGTYLVGARNERRNIEVIEMLCAALDDLHKSGAPHRRLIKSVDDRPGHDTRYAIDPAWIEGQLGWRAETGFAAGLRDTVAWYLEHGEWCRRAIERTGLQRRGLGRPA